VATSWCHDTIRLDTIRVFRLSMILPEPPLALHVDRR
jgi:hypothetical protein